MIDTLAPVLQTHRLVVDRRVVEDDYEVVQRATTDGELSYSIFYQMSRLTAEKGALLHDDRLDCLAMAVAWFQESAALNQRVHHEARRLELLEASLEDEFGYSLLNAQRLAMGLTLEQARRADARADEGGTFSLRPMVRKNRR
jgi:hypothetical protein